MSTNEIARLRAEVRTWLQSNVPRNLELPRDAQMTQEQRDGIVELRRQLGAKGWLAPSWPAYFGGAGLSEMEAAVIQEEMREVRIPRLGLDRGWLTAVRTWGTEEQKGLWLTRTVRGGITVAHNVGANRGTGDIATRSSKSRRDGDHYVLNGEEWYVPSHFPPDYIFLLVTSGATDRRYRNMTTLIIDVKSPGITKRERRTLMRVDETNYILEDVRVPLNQRIGGEGDGWWVAQTMVDVQNGGPGVSPEQQTEIEERERTFWLR